MKRELRSYVKICIKYYGKLQDIKHDISMNKNSPNEKSAKESNTVCEKHNIVYITSK